MSHRIAFCITTLAPGGAERQLVELACRLPGDRYQTAVFVLGPPPLPPQDELIRKTVAEKVPVTFFHARSLWSAGSAIRQLTGCLRSFQPALLQCFLAHANVTGAIAARLAGVPQCVTGIRVADLRWNFHRLASRMTNSLVSRHICVSESVATFAVQRMHLPASKIVVIPNGVDLGRFKTARPVTPAELGIPTGRKLLLFVGRLDRQKQPEWLLARLPELQRRLPNHDLVIVGDGALRGRLERLANQLSLGNHVHFLGWRSDVPSLLAASEMLLLCSAWEGMPGVVLEAMAAGKPVVAIKVHGTAELLGQACEPQTVIAHDVPAFLEKVTQLARDRSRAAELGHQNRIRAEAEFSLEAMTTHYAELYDELLAAAPPSK
jgi:glycosyltransferase involved in cell wall biosynthesis